MKLSLDRLTQFPLRFIHIVALAVCADVASAQIAAGPLDSLPPVRILVNGREIHRAGTLPIDANIVLTNGVVSLRRHARFGDQLAGIVATIIAADTSLTGTSADYGDYTYVGSGVTSAPTYIDVLSLSNNEVVVQWGFGDHRLYPRNVQLSTTAPSEPYPFRKTVWLRRGESGYFTLIEPLLTFSDLLGSVEHEVGFGGLWGPGTVRTGHDSVRIAQLKQTHFLSGKEPTIDAASLLRDGDPVARVLVPLQRSTMVVPLFNRTDFGAVWILGYIATPFGAYLYMAPRTSAASARKVCEFAWRTAPTMLRLSAASGDDIAECGTP